MPDKSCKGVLLREDLALLLSKLTEEGYKVIGPVVRDGAILFEHISAISQLPWGVEDVTCAGSYQLSEGDPNRCFSWNTGPQGLKPWLFKPRQALWRGELNEDGYRFTQDDVNPEPIAVIGVRACDLAALFIQDKHFMHGDIPDPWYSEQRRQLCLIAVNCSRSASTCFCASTGDGPEVTYGYDLLLDEIKEGYLIHSKSDIGNNIARDLPLHQETDTQIRQAQKQIANASKQQKTMPDPQTLRTLLQQLNNQQWQAIAQKCLACGNCTSVCPTCFCSKQQASVEPDTGQYQQVRYWDSCFSEGHGFIAGKRIRGEISQRYRQWLVHKLVTWQEQYGRSGCVGCGRCTTWCPAAIDLVDEVHALLE